MTYRIRTLARKEIVELERLRRVPAHVELHRLSDENPPRKDRQNALLAVGILFKGDYCLANRGTRRRSAYSH